MSGDKAKSGMTLERRRRVVESTATFGLILICVALIVPFFNPTDFALLSAFKWVYSAGALVFVVARVVNVSDPDESMRLKRLRRLEFWAGIAFVMAASFWFYEESHLAALGPWVGVLAVLRNTIMFSLVGAVIQIIASWLIVSQSRKQAADKAAGKKAGKR
ncbi:MAG: hypothetical protein K2M10_00120 [Muribaculaceae bacterium]|nr:hypothetical protein [Muribaculaceae bacterium]MDE5975917.1 hypothetical protein [Muribaculaceae bacterium]MDE6298036.1 hypothetical protein [Muribaculaceae bacterium]